MEIERRIVSSVSSVGWHVINVFEEDNHPPFSYTIGMQKSFSSPELFISGLSGEVSARILNSIASEIKDGRKIENRRRYRDFFGDYESYFCLVDKSYYEEYFGKAIWFYQGENFLVLQCVWPNKTNSFPWETSIKFNQDILFNIQGM